MSKHHHQHKVHPGNRVGASMSVGPENPADPGFMPTYEDIQKRAYRIHEEKGGSDLENWLEAERLLKRGSHNAY